MSLLQEAFFNPPFSLKSDLITFLKQHTWSYRLSYVWAQGPMHGPKYTHSLTHIRVSKVLKEVSIVLE